MDDRMMINELNGITVLSAGAGMLLTNGETVSEMVYLGNLDSAENWTEVGGGYVLPESMTETEQKAAAYDILTGVNE